MRAAVRIAFTLMATAWLYFCATEWGATALLTPLEAAYPAFANEELPTAEAIGRFGWRRHRRIPLWSGR